MNLLADFQYTQLHLPDDYEGKVAATFISSKENTGKRRSVLYIHGFIDYFFQTHVAEEFHKRGYDFYALELRKYGNSMLDHQHPNYCRDITEYYPEITRSLEIIQSNGSPEIILLGHSTGGLVSSMYMNEGEKRDCVSHLILNSPFLELNIPPFKKFILNITSWFILMFNPYAKFKEALSRVYAKSIHIDHNGEWEFNQEWKPVNGFPAYFAWLRAVMKSQKYLRTESNISVPVLVMHSSKSLVTNIFTDEVHKSDVVLNIDHIREIGALLGSDVQLIGIKDGMHDLFLSKKNVRDYALKEMFRWLNSHEI